MPEFPEGGEVRYISPRTMNEVKKRLVLIDQYELLASDLRTMMLQLIAQDTRIDIATESWGIDLDHGCVVRESSQNTEPVQEPVQLEAQPGRLR